MNDGKLNYVVVGAFVVAMLAALVVSLAVLMGRTGATDGYHAFYRNVTGVKFGTQVLYEGYPIGQVEDVTPQSVENGMRFRVDFNVDRGWRIPEDSVAAITAPRLLAAVTINIQAGESATALAPGSTVPSREGADVFSAVSSLAGQVGALTKDGIEPLLASIDDTLGTAREVLASDVKPLARNLAALAETMNGRLPALIDKVDRFTDTMNAAATDARVLVGPQNQEKVAALIGNLDRSAANLSALSVKLDRVATTLDGVVGDNRVNIDRSLADLRHVMRSMSRNIDSVTQNLDGASRNMYEFSRQIRQNPGLLLGGTPPPDTAQGE
jgi:phospholipid/cholesterol/gamma-HCH transport system substrate-binding protein